MTLPKFPTNARTGASGLANKIVLAHLGDDGGTVDRAVVVGSGGNATVDDILTLIEGQNIAEQTLERVGSTLLYDVIGASEQLHGSALQVRNAGSKSEQAEGQTSFLIEALGSGAELARLLGVNRSQPTQWRTGKEKPGPEARRNLLDLYYVVAKALEVYPARAAIDWLNGSNPYLEGARPIDVLKLRGGREVIQALEVAMA